MQPKKVFFFLFAAVILAVPLFLLFRSENILENGHLHKLRLQGYDPFDPFRGKYLRLNYDAVIPCDSTLDKGDEAYVLFREDSLGFSYFAFAQAQQPDHDDYMTAEVLYVRDGMAEIKLDNLRKFFINEDLASEAEQVIETYSREKPDDIYVAIRVLNGEARIDNIFVEEKPLNTFLDQ